jgi:hypothetical protein
MVRRTIMVPLLLFPRLVEAQVTSAPTWQSFSLAEQTGSFTVELDMTPNGSAIDGVTGFADGAIDAYDDTPVALRFNDQGNIDAINGDWYGQVQTIPYAAASTYAFRVEIHLSTSRFSAWVTPPGGSELLLADNHQFRTAQPTVPRIDRWGLIGEIGSFVVNRIEIPPAGNGGGDAEPGGLWECTPGQYYDRVARRCVTPEEASCAGVRALATVPVVLVLLGWRRRTHAAATGLERAGRREVGRCHEQYSASRSCSPRA